MNVWKIASAVAIAVTLTMPTSFTSGEAAAFTLHNTIHPIFTPIVRDHRGTTTPPGPGNGNNPVVRDHRPIPCLGNLC